MNNVLLIGSGNKDKSRELQALLDGSGWDVKSLKDFPDVDEPVEDQDSFEGNALLKAKYYGEHFGVACVADDSGLVVDALGDAPGVYSARYAGENCTYDDNNAKLLRELAGETDRAAHFVCCAAFYGIDGETFTETGTCDGTIASEPRGTNGFGYDPVFIPAGYDQTFGELPPQTKHAVSHRGKAFRALAQRLKQLERSVP